MYHNENDKLYNIGFVKNTHGLNGCVEIKITRQNLDFFKFLNKNLFILINDTFKPFLIENIISKKNNFIIKFFSLNSIDNVISFIKCDIFLSLLDLYDLNIEIERNVSNFDIIDVNNNLLIGKAININYSTKNKILLFENSKNKKTVMVPFVQEFIKKIDYNSKTIFVNLIKGL